MPFLNLVPYLAKWSLPECPPKMLDYFAGFVDGEGCIQLSRTPARNRKRNPEGGIGITVTVTQNDRRPLDRLRFYFGGTVHPRRCNPGTWRKRPFAWMVHGKRAAHFLSLIRDSLIVKQAQADAVLTFAETYFSQWRHCDRAGWPLTDEAVRLRRVTFMAFRAEMDSQSGRGISWGI